MKTREPLQDRRAVPARDVVLPVPTPAARSRHRRRGGVDRCAPASVVLIETVVPENPEGWYSFVDDDNLVLDDAFLYEIPYYDARGYGAMNSVLTPRRGDSSLTFVMDHIRLLSWTVALLAGPIAFAVGQASGELGITLVFRVAPLLAGIVYGGTYAYGALRLSGWHRLPMVISIPLCVVFESLSPVYAVLFADRDFTVISK